MTISEVYNEPYKVLEQWHSQPRHIRIIAVGAGASGLCVAYKAQRNLRNFELQIYEKQVNDEYFLSNDWGPKLNSNLTYRNPDVGGTWYENRYSGCACDV